MEFEIVPKNAIDVYGLQTELTTSQKQNYRIIREHWQNFNNELRIRKLNSDENWQKFGITTKVDGKYFYLSAIPAGMEISDFENFKITGGNFACFHHKGSLELIKSVCSLLYLERQSIEANDKLFDQASLPGSNEIDENQMR